MRKLHNNQINQTSKEYYQKVLKKKTTNLNLSNKQVQETDILLNQLLNASYTLLSPIFEKDQLIFDYKNHSNFKNIDNEFDKTINNTLPSWIKKVILFIKSIYRTIFPLKVEKKIKNTASVTTNKFIILFKEQIKKQVKQLDNKLNHYYINKSSP